MSQRQRAVREPVQPRTPRLPPLEDLAAAPSSRRAAQSAPALERLPKAPKLSSPAEIRQKPGAVSGKALQKTARHVDFTMLLIIIGLVLFGLVMVYSASYYALQSKGQNPYGTVLKQGLIAAVGLVIMFAVMKIDFHFWYKSKIVLLAVVSSLALLVLVLIPGIGTYMNGSRRWIVIPVIDLSLQPGEIAKLVIVLYLAKNMTDNVADLMTFQGFLRHLIVAVAMFGLIMLQPNLSTAGSLIILSLCMLAAGGSKGKHIGLLFAVGAIGALALTYGAEYRMKRLMGFLDPFNPEKLQDDGYQLYQSLLALGSGGLFGSGPGLSRQKALYLPYGDSDFIFAVFAEEYGWVGCVALLGAYLALIRQGIVTALRCADRFGSMLAAGLTMLIAVQVAINIAVVSGSMPTTGLPLPFFSAGGTNLMIYLFAMGILLNISKSARKPQRE